MDQRRRTSLPIIGLCEEMPSSDPPSPNLRKFALFVRHLDSTYSYCLKPNAMHRVGLHLIVQFEIPVLQVASTFERKPPSIEVLSLERDLESLLVRWLCSYLELAA